MRTNISEKNITIFDSLSVDKSCVENSNSSCFVLDSDSLDAMKQNIASLKKVSKNRIFGQDNVIDTIVNNIFFNQRFIDTDDNDLIKNRTNILLVGPAGSGKSYIIKKAASGLNIPVTFIPIGYLSECKKSNLDYILCSLVDIANGDLDLAQRGIVVLDKVNKLCDLDKDFVKRVQLDLLDLLKGDTVDINYKGDSYKFDTSKLTFIATGDYYGDNHNDISFNNLSIEGLDCDFLDNFKCITITNGLKVEDLENILRNSLSSPLHIFKILEKIFRCSIVIDSSLIHLISKKAFEMNMGANGLNIIVERIKDVISSDLLAHKEQIIINEGTLKKISGIGKMAYHGRGNVKS